MYGKDESGNNGIIAMIFIRKEKKTTILLKHCRRRKFYRDFYTEDMRNILNTKWKLNDHCDCQFMK